MTTSTHRTIRLVLSLFAISAACANAKPLAKLTPAQEYNGATASVREVLEPHGTESEIISFSGSLPRRCIKVSGGTRICVIPLNNRNSGWSPLAAELDTGDRLNLLCEFYEDDRERAPDSCSVHAQRSNRRYYSKKIPKNRGNKRVQKRVILEAKSHLKKQANELIDGARTALELSNLMGDAPYDCHPSAESYVCSWLGSNATYGHGTLAMSIGVPFRKKVRLLCTLPSDGSPRAPDSCTVSIGG